VRLLITADAVATGEGMLGDSTLVVDGRVAAVGAREDLETDGMELKHYPGATLIPGLRDAHLHPVPYAALLDGCSLKQARNVEDLQHRLAEYAMTLDEGQPVVATRLDDKDLAERRLPTRQDLDVAVPDRPAVIYRYCGHVAVVNTAALAASNITAETPNPEGGSIDKAADRTPSGVLRETATGLVAPALARGGRLLRDEALLSALRGLAGIGITSIGAMIGYGERPFEHLESELELWRRVAYRLPIRVHGFAITDTAPRLEDAARLLGNCGRRLRWAGVKRFADGSLGGHTAAMNTPFSDLATLGTLRLTDIDEAVAEKSIELGGVVAIHAIGDRAVDGVLSIFERLIARGAKPDDLRMEHVSVISPVQVARFADLGVTAVVQPAFLASEFDWVEDRVGPRRAAWLYPFRSLLESGIPMAGSSDCPVEPPQPLWGMAAAMDRYGIAPDQRLTGGPRRCLSSRRERREHLGSRSHSPLAAPPTWSPSTRIPLPLLRRPFEKQRCSPHSSMVLRSTWIDRNRSGLASALKTNGSGQRTTPNGTQPSNWDSMRPTRHSGGRARERCGTPCSGLQRSRRQRERADHHW
jgi:predicted amidohydrolase YtcJ